MSYEVWQTEEFSVWLDELTDQIARKALAKCLVRVAGGLFGDSEPVGGGVSELRVHVGQGYELTIRSGGRTVVFMLCGGDKSTQRRDIARAQELAIDLRA